MDAYLPIAELVKGGCLPTGQRDGLLMILRAYFDDSGSHNDSVVTVLGGLIGSVEQWARFEAAWSARLADPLPGYGKPPLKMFHLSDCVWRKRGSEFEGYSEAEADAVRHDFRRIIIDCKLTSISNAVDTRSWDELIIGPIRNLLGDSVSLCFNKCIEESARIVTPSPGSENLAIWFDRGIQRPFLDFLAGLWLRPDFPAKVKSINFAKVEDVLPLQGADIVATENYWFAANWLTNGRHPILPTAHLRHFLDNMLYQGAILDRDGIESERRRRDPLTGRVL